MWQPATPFNTPCSTVRRLTAERYRNLDGSITVVLFTDDGDALASRSSMFEGFAEMVNELLAGLIEDGTVSYDCYVV